MLVLMWVVLGGKLDVGKDGADDLKRDEDCGSGNVA